MTDDLTRTLTARLHEAAGRPAPTRLDDSDAIDAIYRAREQQVRRRYQRASVGAGVIAAVAAVIAGTLTLIGTDAGPGQVAAPAAQVYDVPPRGSLADDATLIAALQEQSWLNVGYPEVPAAADRRVVFAGDVPGARWALVVGYAGGQWMGQWFTADPDADPSDYSPAPAGIEAYGPELPTLVNLTPDIPRTALVVITDPGTTVEVSQRATVAADGTVTRTYDPVPTTEGVAITELTTNTKEGTAARYRLVTDAGPGPSVALLPFGGVDLFDPPELTALRPSSDPVAPETIDQALTAITIPTATTPDDLSPQLLWAHNATTIDGDPVDVAVIATTLPSGALAISTAWSQINPDGSGSAGLCGVVLFPAGTDPSQVAVTSGCTVTDPDRPSLYVTTAPTTVTTATYAIGDAVIGVPLQDGSTTVPRLTLSAGFDGVSYTGTDFLSSDAHPIATYDSSDVFNS